jgi:hypothetical protein
LLPLPVNRTGRSAPAPGARSVSPMIGAHGRRPKLAAVPALRPIAAGVAAVALSLVVGCASFDRAFGKREIVVVFKNATPAQVMLKVRAACSHIPAAIPEPIPPHPLAIDLPSDIRYLVSNASDAEVARLEQCLSRFPSVAGVNPESPSGS